MSLSALGLLSWQWRLVLEADLTGGVDGDALQEPGVGATGLMRQAVPLFGDGGAMGEQLLVGQVLVGPEVGVEIPLPAYNDWL